MWNAAAWVGITRAGDDQWYDTGATTPLNSSALPWCPGEPNNNLNTTGGLQCRAFLRWPHHMRGGLVVGCAMPALLPCC